MPISSTEGPEHSSLIKPFEQFYSILCDDDVQAVAVKSQLQQLARPMYSNPPLHGALIVSTILSDPESKTLWLKEVKVKVPSLLFMVKVQKIHNPLDNYEKWKVMGLMMNYLTIAQGMSDRIIGMRKSLKENLESLGSPLSWEHVTNQVNAQ